MGKGARLLKSVCFRTGGLSEDNVSQSIRWDNRQTEPLCAFVSETDQMWHSDKCSNKKHFYCSFIDRIEYFRIAQSWYNASHYCQKFSGQLVNMHPITALSLNKTGWIGGYKRNDIWKWVGNFTPSVTKWATNETQSQDCAAYNVYSKMYLRTSCSERFHPLCLNDNLLVVKENKTWEEAVNYCLALNGWKKNQPHRRYKFNLLSLYEGSDYNYIRDRIYTATTTEVRLLLVGSVIKTKLKCTRIQKRERKQHILKYFLFHAKCGFTFSFSGMDWPALPGRVMVVDGWAQS